MTPADLGLTGPLGAEPGVRAAVVLQGGSAVPRDEPHHHGLTALVGGRVRPRPRRQRTTAELLLGLLGAHG